MQKSNFAEMNISRIWRVSKQTSFTVELGEALDDQRRSVVVVVLPLRYYDDGTKYAIVLFCAILYNSRVPTLLLLFELSR